MRICESAGLLQTGCDCSARFLCMFCRLGTLLHAFVVCDVVCALPTRGPIQRVVACAVTMCADVCEYKLDQRRSSDSSTDISITHFELKERKKAFLTHALHRAPSASSETWSGGCSLLFERAAGSRDCTLDASPIINDDIAREDAVRFHHQTAARRCVRARSALSRSAGAMPERETRDSHTVLPI